jgi:hypothetical protein
VVLCVLSFFGGTIYQKHHTGSSSTPASSFAQAHKTKTPKKNVAQQLQKAQQQVSAPKGKSHLGQIKTISPTHVTISAIGTGKSESFTVTSATQVTLSGKDVPLSSLHKDYRAVVISQDGKKADQIVAAPPPAKAKPGSVPLSTN